MEQTVFKHKPPATLRERVKNRRRRAGLRSFEETTWQTTPIREKPAPNRQGVLRRARWPRMERILIQERLPRAFVILLLSAAALIFLLPGLTAGARKARAQSPAAVSNAPLPTPTPKRLVLPANLPPGEKTTILLLGSDRRASDASFRTDVIVLVTVDPRKGEVSAISFPRDLIAKIPGYGDDRINVVMQSGGFALMQKTLEQSYGARPKYYFMTNFAGFTGLINSIGGIEVDAAQPLTDDCDLYWSKAGQCEILPGRHTMDGATALWYIRSRHTSSDFDRLRRAQEVLYAIFSRFMSVDALTRLPELYTQYHQDVETNMDISHVLSLLPTAAQVAQEPSRLHRYAISPNEAADWWMANGARVLLPDYDAVRRIVQEAGAGE